MSEFTQFLADCWRMFEEVQVPVLNISFAKLYLGVFVVSISIIILRPLLGIGGVGFGNNIMHGVKRGYDRAYTKAQARKREAYNNSYEKYKADKDRAAAYAKRYKEGK